VLDLIKM